jgi:hypothetical protein
MALYVISPWGLKQVADFSQISIELLKRTASSENWHGKKKQYNQLDNEDKRNFKMLNLLLNGVVDDDSKVKFVNDVFTRIDASKEKRDKEQIRQQIESRIKEFLGDEATHLLSQYESAITGKESIDYGVESDVTQGDKIESLNQKYKYFASALNEGVSDCHDKLRELIDYHFEIMRDARGKRPANISYEEIVRDMRNIGVNTQTLRSLIAEYSQLSGVSGYVDHHAAIAKLFSNGYYVMHRDAVKNA